MTELPTYISLVFGLTTAVTLFLFYRAIKRSSSETTNKKATPILTGLIIWLIIQAVLTLKHVYNPDPASMPPRIFLFGAAPAMLVIILAFVTRRGRKFVDSLPLVHITYINLVRVPVEIVLWWLFINKTVPQLMTFEGRNFDIIAGLTAPFVAYFGLIKQKLSRRQILIWNVSCLALLLNIVVIALLSAPSPLQKISFDQPNRAIFYFPFSWLPTGIVPIMLFGHLTSIRQLLQPQTA